MLDIQLILVDIDGTLLNDQNTVTPQTIAAIAKLKQKNIRFGIATGRTPYAVKRLLKDWKIKPYVDLILGFNGACFLDMHTLQMHSFDMLDGQCISQIFTDFAQYDFNAGIYDKNTFHVLKKDKMVMQIAEKNKLQLIIDDLSQYQQKQIEKMLLIADPQEIDKMTVHYQTLKNRNYKAVRSTRILLEFLNPELSKSKGIMHLCQTYHIDPSKVLTFGDELNDYEMIRDYQGVAMANANPKIKEVATYITRSNNDDGIACFINTYICNENSEDR